MKNYINNWEIKLDKYSNNLWRLYEFNEKLLFLQEVSEEILDSVGIKSIKDTKYLCNQEVQKITSKYNKLRAELIRNIEVSREKGKISSEEIKKLKSIYPHKLSINAESFFILGKSDYKDFKILINNFDPFDDYIYFVSNFDLLILGLLTYCRINGCGYGCDLEGKYREVLDFLLSHKISEIKEYIDKDDLGRIGFKYYSAYNNIKWFYHLPEEFNNFIKLLLS